MLWALERQLQRFGSYVSRALGVLLTLVLASSAYAQNPSPDSLMRDLCRNLFSTILQTPDIKDQFLANETPNPKEAVASYVRANGFRTPENFSSFEEALSYYFTERKPIILRSEHPIEYNGPSGVFESLVFKTEYLTEALSLRKQLKLTDEKLAWLTVLPVDVVARDFRKDIPYLLGYLQLGKLSPPDFLEILKGYAFNSGSEKVAAFARQSDPKFSNVSDADIYRMGSFSFQTLERGFNISVAMDSGRPNAYHVFMNSYSAPGAYGNGGHYFLVDQAANILSHHALIGEIPALFASKLKDIIRFYEGIRTLPHFDQKHAPLMEMSLDEEGPSFLQYHRIKDQRPMSAGEQLRWQYGAGAGEVEAPFVHGVTQSASGIVVSVKVVPYSDRPKTSLTDHPNVAVGGVASFLTDELISRRRKVNIIFGIAKKYLRGTTNGHAGRSDILKPELTLILPLDSILTETEIDHFHHGSAFDIELEIRSNGTQAFVRRLK